MGEMNPLLYAFNRGLVSPLALARQDVKRLALSAERQTNWMPRLLGSMMLRPGLGYTGSGTQANARAKLIPFIAGTEELALIEITDGSLRFRVPATAGAAPESLVTRGAVSTVVANGNPFDGALTSWTAADETGASSAPVAIMGVNYMKLLGTGFNAAKRYQTVTVAPADQAKEHAVRILVAQESIRLRIGSSVGADDYVNERTLGTGTHSLTLTPSGNFTIQLQNNVDVEALVQSVAIEAAGPLTLPAPWPAAALNPCLLRWDQTGDVLYVACDGYQQRLIKRTLGSSDDHAWSIELFQPEDGPFRVQNTGPVTLTPSATTGHITLGASEPLFYAGHVGALFRIASVGQHAEVAAAGSSQFSAPIKVSGLTADRSVGITIAGTFVGTVVLQRSVGEIGAWSDVAGQSYAAPTTTTFNDGLDNQIIFYRIGIDAAYTSGTANASLDLSTGSLTGILRVTKFVDSKNIEANVLTRPGDTGVLAGLGSTKPSADWWESEWSDFRGWPTAIVFHEGRLWWAGRGKIIGSVPDAFDSYDDTIDGDSGPLNRTLGAGAVDVTNWLLSLQRLIIGTPGTERSVRSSSFDAPLTPTDFVVKDASTQGSAKIGPAKIDANGVFIQKSGTRVFELVYSPNYFMLDYTANDITRYVPDIAISEEGTLFAEAARGFAGLAVQRMPDTRVHAWLNDGTVRVCVIDPGEEALCWVKVATPGAGGFVEDIVVLPGPVEDYVYYIVRRTVNGATVRYLERWAREDECIGGTLTKLADSFLAGSNSPASAAIAGLGHLEGLEIICWADGKDQGTATVAGGVATIGAAVTDWVVGLAYTAQFKSAKLLYAAQLGAALGQRKRVSRIGFNLLNTHYQGLQYGPDFATLDSLPLVVQGAVTPADTVWGELEDDSDLFPGGWATDARICLQAAAPRPCTVSAAVFSMETREKV